MEMEVSRIGDNRGKDDSKETLYMMGGVALMIFGAGLVLSNPLVRRYLGQTNMGGLVSAAVPDLERYLRLRAM
jgi:hypothetical protein